MLTAPTAISARAVRWSLGLLCASALALSGCTAPDTEVPGDTTRVLQSVDLSVDSDGALTSVDSTTISTSATAAEAVTSTTSYSPSDVVDDVPVRVLTSYRTDEGSGTNLADLKGYTGRIELSLTIENLTSSPQDLTYDVGGQSYTEQALVGVPMTVVASTQMKGVSASTVVTSSADEDGVVTNGVLSQTQDGTAVVQWATILAPVQLSSSETFNLVLDAKGFEVPSFDITAQPGLAADASLGTLLDSSFNAASQTQAALVSRTIETIGDVNVLLAKASETIGEVRENLDSTSKTLGVKTAERLQSSTDNVSTSMKELSVQLSSLQSDLDSSVESSQSAVLEQLKASLDEVDQMLGDTSYVPPATTTDGAGCEVQVASPDAASSVYASLMSVTGQLKAYASATDACKVELQSGLMDSIGPAEPTADTCDTPSATCSLYATQQDLYAVSTDLLSEGQAAIAALQPEIMDDTTASFDQLSTQVDAVSNQFALLSQAQDAGTVSVTEAEQQLTALVADLTTLRSTINSLHEQALANVAVVGDSSAPAADSLVAQNDALATAVCSLIDAGTLDATQGEALRAYITDTSCPDATGATTALEPPTGYTAAMNSRLADQATAWQDMADALNLDDSTQDLATLLDQLDAEAQAATDALDQSTGAASADIPSVSDALSDLGTGIADLTTYRDAMQPNLVALQDQQDQLAETLNEVFTTAAGNADAQVAALDENIRALHESAAAESQALADMFERSTEGMQAAADEIESGAGGVIDEQRSELASGQQDVTATLDAQVTDALTSISTAVDAATVDSDAVATQLTDDLNRVLLDLGTRKVNGSGLLGAMTTSAATTELADYQLTLATSTADGYANVRSEDLQQLMLRQAQINASLQAQAELPAFKLALPTSVQHHTVYLIHVGGNA